MCVCVSYISISPPHPLASTTTPPHPTHPVHKAGWTPIYVAASMGQTDAVKELISAGCDINLAAKVKQMTRLALALALRAFRARLPFARCVCLSSLANIYIFVCMHTQIRMRMVIRILTLVQSGGKPLQVAEKQGHASIATLIRDVSKRREEENAKAKAAAELVSKRREEENEKAKAAAE